MIYNLFLYFLFSFTALSIFSISNNNNVEMTKLTADISEGADITNEK